MTTLAILAHSGVFFWTTSAIISAETPKYNPEQTRGTCASRVLVENTKLTQGPFAKGLESPSIIPQLASVGLR